MPQGTILVLAGMSESGYAQLSAGILVEVYPQEGKLHMYNYLPDQPDQKDLEKDKSISATDLIEELQRLKNEYKLVIVLTSHESFDAISKLVERT